MNYDAGVQLYMQYGSNATLKRVLSNEEETAFKREKLKEALTQLLTADKSPASHPKSLPQIPTEQQFKHWPPQPIEDIVLAALYNQWKPLYGEMKSLQHRIDEVAQQGGTDPNKLIEAGQMAIQILNLEDEIDGIYYQRDYYYQNKELPAAATTEEMTIVDPAKWGVELEKYKRYVRRYTKWIADRPNNKNVANWASLLKKAMDMVAHYKKLLNIDE